MKSKVLMVLAGAALSSVAFAATPDTDRAYAAELSADASARNSALAAGGDHFKLTAGDSTLYFGGYTQLRWTNDFRSSGSTTDQDKYTTGFSIPNTRLQFWGNTWSKELTYKVDFNLGGADGGATLQDAEFRYTWDNGFYFRGGQFKLAGLRETLVGDEKQLSASRSVVGDFFSIGRSQGVEIGSTADQFRWAADFSDGQNANNTDYIAANEADLALTGRVEFQAMGTDWSRWNDFTSFKETDSNGLLIGGMFHWQQSGRTGDGDFATTKANTPRVKGFTYSVDASYEASGWNLFGAFMGNHSDNQTIKTDNWGFVFQGGVFATDQLELFARWDYLKADENVITVGNRKPQFLTLGTNYYVSPRSHTFKITADVVWSMKQTNGFQNNNTNAGVLGQDKKGEIAVQVQAQVCW